MIDDVDYVDEFGDHASADVRVEATVGEASSALAAHPRPHR